MYLLRSLFKDPQGDMSKLRNTGKFGVDNVLYSVSEESDNQFDIKTRESCDHSVILGSNVFYLIRCKEACGLIIRDIAYMKY